MFAATQWVNIVVSRVCGRPSTVDRERSGLQVLTLANRWESEPALFLEADIAVAPDDHVIVDGYAYHVPGSRALFC